MALTPLRQKASQKRARSEPAEQAQPGAEHQPDGPRPEGGPPTKRQRVQEPPSVAKGSDLSAVAVRRADFESLPNELRQKVFRNVLREVANRPNRLQALADLEGLLEHNTNFKTNFKNLVDKTPDLNESKAALERHPDVESRYVALCRDVVGGIPLEAALRQNGPLPEADEKLHVTDVEQALVDGTPKHLANLADAFAAQTGPAFKEALKGVARATAGGGRERLSSADIASLTTLAGAFTTKHLNPEDSDLKAANKAAAMDLLIEMIDDITAEGMSPAQKAQLFNTQNMISVACDVANRLDKDLDAYMAHPSK